jgi:UDP-perosamine 4-acetyltransferase
MMDKIVVVGGGGHGKVVISIIQKIDDYEIVGYTDVENKGEILGIKYLGNDKILEELFLNKNIKNAAIGIGQIKNVEARKDTIEKLTEIGFEFPVIISPDATINEDVKIGNGTVVMDGVVINTGTEIGKFCIINTNSAVDHDCNIGDYVHIAPGVTISGGVKIGNNTFIGAGTTIIQYKEIGENIIIGAGSVVVKDLIDSGTYFGVPARK